MDEKNSQLLLYLIGSFEMSAMQFMGKIKNPITDKIERSLEQAQFSIDMLDMLKEKTINNLSEYETKFLEQILSQLKLNYVEEQLKEPKETSSESETKDK